MAHTATDTATDTEWTAATHCAICWRPIADGVATVSRLVPDGELRAHATHGETARVAGFVSVVSIVAVYGHTFHTAACSATWDKSMTRITEHDARLYFGMLPCTRCANINSRIPAEDK